MSKAIILQNINKSYKDKEIYRDFNFRFEPSKLYAVLGASGSGKTTLLNIISGLTSYSGVCSRSEDISYIFQTDRLIETLTVVKNLEYVLKQKYPDKALRRAAAEEMLTAVELKDEANKYPGQLSGGMRQRVSMARAFCYPGDILLMDEPFKSLDISLKYKMLRLFLNLWQKDRRTVIFVTHDIDEALFTADTVCVLDGLPAQFVFNQNILMPNKKRDIAAKELVDLRKNILDILL